MNGAEIGGFEQEYRGTSSLSSPHLLHLIPNVTYYSEKLFMLLRRRIELLPKHSADSAKII